MNYINCINCINCVRKQREYTIDDMFGNEICIICLNEISSNQKRKVLDCGHIYHKHCIQKWFEVKKICPICK